MGYAIIRNAKYKMANMQSISRHNERQNESYGNEDIDVEKKDLNYHLKQPLERSYEKEFERLKEENNLKGNLRLTGKKQSNVVCEFLITSDNEFFNRIGEAETKRYFEEAYKFACNKCGEKNIISAVVHMDETTPHMHLTYVPVVQGKNRKGQPVEKINCSEFWKGFNSYGELQDKFHEHMKERGFDLERGQKVEGREERREHLSVQKYKEKTLKEKINDLSHEANALKTELNALESSLKKVESIKVRLEEVNAIEGKSIPFNKHMVAIDTKTLEYLKDLGKRQHILEDKIERLETENNEFRKRTDRNIKKDLERYDKESKLAKENVKLKQGIQHLSKFLEERGLKDKANEYIREQSAKKVKNHNLDMTK